MNPTRPQLAPVIVAALLLAGEPASAETCTATASGTWGPIDSGTASWSCTPDASDDFVVPNGVTVTVVDDLLQGTQVDTGIRVQSGGTLDASVSAATGSLAITLGPDGLLCDPGSSCILRGRYREANVPSPGLLADYDPDEHFVLGYLNLGSGGASVRVEYPEGRGFHLASLSAIGAGDVLCFFDPDLSDSSVPADVNYCYEVTAVDWSPGSGPAWLEFDVRQGASDHAAMPLTRRDVIATQLAADIFAGARDVIVASGGLAGIPRLTGRFLRFSASDGKPELDSYRILDSATASDSLTIGDARGFDAGHASGAQVWIDYGWRTGDPFFVMVPAVLRSALAPATDQGARITFQGDVTLRALLLDQIGRMRIDGSGALVSQFKDVWLRDPGANNTQAVEFLDLAVDVTVNHLSVTGIDETLPRTHSVYLRDNPDTGFDVELYDVAIRHNGDDCFSAGNFPGDVTAQRFRCQFATDIAQSCNLFSFSQLSGGNTSVTDAECVDCVAQRKPGLTDKLFIPATTGTSSVSGVLAWGAEGQIGDASEVSQTFTDVLFLGGGPNRTGPLVPRGTTGCVVRESVMEPGGGVGVALTAEGVRDCIVRDVMADNFSYVSGSQDDVIENVVIVNADTNYQAISANVLRPIWSSGVTDTTRMSRITVAWMPGVETTIEGGLVPSGTPEVGDDIQVDGLLISGHHVTAGSGAPYAIFANSSQMQAIDWGGAGPCLYDNDTDLSSGAQSGAPGSIVQGQAPGFVDPSAGRFDTTPGSVADLNGCGIDRGVDAPGIHGYRWMHAIARVAPEIMADDPDGDGIVDDTEASLCASGASSDCSDNCSATFNPAQGDADGDALGDACDLACDDGVDNDGDGFTDGGDGGCVSSSDPFEEVQDVVGIPPNAPGASIGITVSGFTFVIPTQEGQTQVEIAAAVAAAINADPILALTGISAVASGNDVETNGTIDSFDLNPGPPTPTVTRVPGLAAWAVLALGGLLACSGIASARRVAPARRNA